MLFRSRHLQVNMALHTVCAGSRLQLAVPTIKPAACLHGRAVLASTWACSTPATRLVARTALKARCAYTQILSQSSLCTGTTTLCDIGMSVGVGSCALIQPQTCKWWIPANYSSTSVRLTPESRSIRLILSGGLELNSTTLCSCCCWMALVARAKAPVTPDAVNLLARCLTAWVSHHSGCS